MDFNHPQYFYEPINVFNVVDERDLDPFNQIYSIDYEYTEKKKRRIEYARRVQEERRLFVEQFQREQHRRNVEYNALQALEEERRRLYNEYQRRARELENREKIVEENIKTVEKTMQKIENINGGEQQLDALEPRPLPQPSSKKEENIAEAEKCCIVCWDRERNVVCLPCTHLIMCFECSNAIKTCPICKRAIENSIKCIVS